tara:strand:+ start:679 stop:1329 length:651 start_codon:yes stop_codon:yes gene_type:complete
MSILIERLNKIKSNISSMNLDYEPEIVAVSKTFSMDHIKPIINEGHVHFGENKVQEALSKWKSVKIENAKIKLHMLGKLQSNKAKKAIEIFDFIHSLDNADLANKLSKYETSINKKLNYFIQVNIGMESQKSGIAPNKVKSFFEHCKSLNMNVIGLMAIPPNDDNTDKYFKEMNELNKSIGLKELSLGMSQDYLLSLKHKSTFLRIGSAIFGERFK